MSIGTWVRAPNADRWHRTEQETEGVERVVAACGAVVLRGWRWTSAGKPEQACRECSGEKEEVREKWGAWEDRFERRKDDG